MEFAFGGSDPLEKAFPLREIFRSRDLSVKVIFPDIFLHGKREAIVNGQAALQPSSNFVALDIRQDGGLVACLSKAAPRYYNRRRQSLDLVKGTPLVTLRQDIAPDYQMKIVRGMLVSQMAQCVHRIIWMGQVRFEIQDFHSLP